MISISKILISIFDLSKIKQINKRYILIMVFFSMVKIYSQDIDIFRQYYGRYSYLAIGNTLNPAENNPNTFCDVLTTSSADLCMTATQVVKEAYIYWAGSGSGDTNITLNGEDIEADDTLNVTFNNPILEPLTYFSCYKNITDQIKNTGNATYTVKNLSITDVLTANPGYCINRTNFAGWAIFIIYEEATLPLNQVNLFHGLEIIDSINREINITISNLNVIDDDDAIIGFLAWEGDNTLNFGESLVFQGQTLEDLPLNPADNAFNSTNTYTGSNTLYNMDLDVYDIEGIINIGDTQANIKLTTGAVDPVTGLLRADLIIINNIITVLNNQLPDARPIIDKVSIACNKRDVFIEYTINNLNSTDPLPANTPIAFYANTTLVGQNETKMTLDVGESENNTIILSIPNTVPDDFELFIVADDDGLGNGTVQETNEFNNRVSVQVSLINAPILGRIPLVESCDKGNNTAVFDITQVEEVLTSDPNVTYTYYETLINNNVLENEIVAPENYTNISYPQSVYVLIDNGVCFEIAEIPLKINNCLEKITQEGISPNNDGQNDEFSPDEIYNIFDDLEIKIFNRYGTLVFEGRNENPWNGYANRGVNKGNLLPVSTYYYIIYLNDPDYSDPVTGWIYLNY